MIPRLVIFLGVLAMSATPLVVSAQSTTPSAESGNPLAAICTGFLAEGAGSVSGDKIKLCNCLVRETNTRLSKSEMEAYAQATLGSQAPPAAVMDKVIAIAARCLQEAR